MMHETPLPIGYHPLPPGHLANVVTCLEMTAKPALRPAPDERLHARAHGRCRHRALPRAVPRHRAGHHVVLAADPGRGETRPPSSATRRCICLALVKDGQDIGLLELDFREDGAVRALLLRRGALRRGRRGRALPDERGADAGLGAAHLAHVGAHLPLRPSQRTGLLPALRLPALSGDGGGPPGPAADRAHAAAMRARRCR